MTPSGAHDSAWQREPEHDEMTIACRDYIEREMTTFHLMERDKVHVHELVGVWCETFFPEGNTFADILARWECKYRDYDRGPEQTRRVYAAFEIKPKLYSAGAAYRQKQVLLQRLKAWASDPHTTYHDTHLTYVIAREGDPLVQTYLNLSRGSIYLWGGESLRKESWKRPEMSTPAKAAE
jgi:hypothetical protein